MKIEPFHLKDKDQIVVFHKNLFDKCVESALEQGPSLPEETIYGGQSPQPTLSHQRREPRS